MKSEKITKQMKTIKKIFFMSLWASLVLSAGCGETSPDNMTSVSQSGDVTVSPADTVTDASLEDNTDAAIQSGDDSSLADSNEANTENESLTNLVNKDDTPQIDEDATKDTSVNMIMVGDILLHTNLEKYYRQPDGSYDYTNIFANTVSRIQDADIALVNEEVIIGGEELGISGYPCFNAPFAIGHELIETGFDVICHGTNHAMDKGKRGILNCIGFWNDNYPAISVLGIHDSEESKQNVCIYEKNGIKIALLNYTYGTNGIELPSDMPFAVDLLKESQVRADIQYAKANADFTVVCPHWGTEYRLTADSMQEKWTKIFLEEKVDLVIGTHPHVIEPVEMITDEETGHNMLVYYSLGNFINWTGSSGSGISNRMVGGMADITITKDADGNTFISDYDVDALVCHLIRETNGPTTYFLRDYSKELADANAVKSQDGAFSYEYCIKLCNDVWNDLWE